MDISSIERLLVEASKITNHRHFVIAGSLAVIGAVISPPHEMVVSTDVDLYPKLDPGRATDIAAALGEGSAFHKNAGIYAAITPAILSLPSGWEDRLIQMPFSSGVTAWFLDPNDTAISKCVRGEPRDMTWIRCGLQAGILSKEVILARLKTVENVLPGEIELGTERVLEIRERDEAWRPSIK